MKQSRRVFIPAITIVAIGIALIIYSHFFMPSGVRHAQPTIGNDHRLPAGGGHFPRRKGGLAETFKLFGTFAIICGAINFSWFYLKRKLKSPSKLIAKLGKILYKVHTYVGLTALLFVVAHGAYYFIKDFNNPATYTGIAAFVIFLTLAIYGWFIKKVRNKFMRTTHFLLSNAWIVVLLVHAGGHLVLPAALTLVVWGGIWYVDTSARKLAMKHG